MAKAEHSAGVKRGYKPKTKRVTKPKPNASQRVLRAVRQGTREFVEFARDEVVYATIDTAQLLEYLRYALKRETRTRVKPVVQEWEAFVQEHELVRDVGTFAVDQASALNVGRLKR